LELERKRDVRLVGRAIREGWNVDKKKVVKALMGALADPDLMIDSAKLLIAADALDLKRDELEAKEHAGLEERRLQLLELARRVPAGELAKLASSVVIETPKDNGKPKRSRGGQG
jgi:hypothetical protein